MSKSFRVCATICIAGALLTSERALSSETLLSRSYLSIGAGIRQSSDWTEDLLTSKFSFRPDALPLSSDNKSTLDLELGFRFSKGHRLAVAYSMNGSFGEAPIVDNGGRNIAWIVEGTSMLVSQLEPSTSTVSVTYGRSVFDRLEFAIGPSLSMTRIDESNSSGVVRSTLYHRMGVMISSAISGHIQGNFGMKTSVGYHYSAPVEIFVKNSPIYNEVSIAGQPSYGSVSGGSLFEFNPSHFAWKVSLTYNY